MSAEDRYYCTMFASLVSICFLEYFVGVLLQQVASMWETPVIVGLLLCAFSFIEIPNVLTNEGK